MEKEGLWLINCFILSLFLSSFSFSKKRERERKRDTRTPPSTCQPDPYLPFHVWSGLCLGVSRDSFFSVVSFFLFFWEKKRRQRGKKLSTATDRERHFILGMRMKALHGCCWRTCSSHLNGSYLRSPSKWLDWQVLPLGLDLSSLSFLKRKKKGKIGPREPPQPGNNFSIKSLVPRAWRLFFPFFLSFSTEKERKERMADDRNKCPPLTA